MSVVHFACSPLTVPPADPALWRFPACLDLVYCNSIGGNIIISHRQMNDVRIVLLGGRCFKSTPHAHYLDWYYRFPPFLNKHRNSYLVSSNSLMFSFPIRLISLNYVSSVLRISFYKNCFVLLTFVLSCNGLQGMRRST